MQELTEKERRANTLIMALTNAVYQLVNKHGLSRERIHELVDRALDV